MNHGTLTAYHHHGCRCEPCVKVASAYDRNRRRQMAYGRWAPLVDAEPARQHVRALGEQGMGWMRVAEVSGVARGSVSKLLYGDPRRGSGPSRRIKRENAERLLAVKATPTTLRPNAAIRAHGTIRRLRALAVMGYGTAWIAERTGLGTAALHRLRHGDRSQCEVATWRAIRDLYAQCAMTPQVAPRAAAIRRHARATGWAGPLDWDDIDHPHEGTARGWAKKGPRKQVAS